MFRRQNIRDMPYRRRQDGVCSLDRLKELAIWKLALFLLTLAQNLPQSPFSYFLHIFGVILVQLATNARLMLWRAVDPNNRNIASFSDEDAWRDLRFRLVDLPILFRLLRFPAYIILQNGMMVDSEYAFLVFLYRMHYPSTLAMMQNKFGRDYSQISRIFNAVVVLMDDQHRHKVMGNLPWYSSRFDVYNYVINNKIATVTQNPNPGMVPRQLNNLFGFIDGQARKIGRLHGNNNAQFPFWNGYYHMHCIIYLGISFPDGMVVIDTPFPGYFTDVMTWGESLVRHQLVDIMNIRIQNGHRRLKLYGDKIFDTCQLITAAYSLRNGFVFNWMHTLNFIMSPIRVAVEWAFGKIIARNKHSEYRQFIQKSPVTKIHNMSVLLANCHTCLYGGQCNTAFELAAPTIFDYMSQ
jgi:hypothetical protein